MRQKYKQKKKHIGFPMCFF